jgi:hypothetical protein
MRILEDFFPEPRRAYRIRHIFSGITLQNYKKNCAISVIFYEKVIPAPENRKLQGKGTRTGISVRN